jgi:hypothetical protein
MFIKVHSKINPEDNFYYVTVVSPASDMVQIASSDYPLMEGLTYRATPKVHWVGDGEDSSLAHFKIYGKQKPMEHTV